MCRRAVRRLPGGRQAQPDELAEDLRQLGAGDEVAIGTEPDVALVVAERRVAERQRHEGGDVDRAGLADQLGNARLERGRLGGPGYGRASGQGVRPRDA